MRLSLPHLRPLDLLRVRPNAVTYGVVAGLLAVGVQIVFNVQPPPAYGIGMACHTRDLVNWVLKLVAGVRWEIAPLSLAVPLLTTVGLYLGAALAARRHREFRPLALGHGLRSFVFGVLVMNFAIIALGCPTRLLLLGAYGEVLGLLGAVGVILLAWPILPLVRATYGWPVGLSTPTVALAVLYLVAEALRLAEHSLWTDRAFEAWRRVWLREQGYR